MARLQLSVRVVMILAALSVLFLLIGGRAEADIPQLEPVVHVVEPGDTLWRIASWVAGPEHDLRRVVSEIQALNALDGATIHPGQRLLLPAAY